MKQFSILFVFTLQTGRLFADTTDQRKLDFFESRIRPVLAEQCYSCHSASAKKLKGELLLDSRWGWQKGGESGPPIVPGNPEESLIIDALRHESFKMPPKTKLPETVILDFVRWIEDGAVDPREKKTLAATETNASFNLEERRKWWSLQPVREVEVPDVKQRYWPRVKYDCFILAALEKTGWQPAPPASRRSWLRRVTYDLTGLPPRPEAVQDFVTDRSVRAYERVVDRLLSSPHFGERWARHWMDLVRYAESKAFGDDYPMANVFHYRDYLIRTFNADVPYNQFVREAIAGDLLEPSRCDSKTGISESPHGPGFLYLTDGQHGPPDIHGDQARIFEDMIDVVGKAFLAQTIACARCHDHKFDAITTKDYYSLYGVIASSRLEYVNITPPKRQKEFHRSLADLKTPIRLALADILAKDMVNVRKDLLAVQSGQVLTAQQKRWAVALEKTPNELLKTLSLLLVEVVQHNSASSSGLQNRDKTPPTPWLGNPTNSRTSFGQWQASGRAFGETPRHPGDFVVAEAGERVISSFVGGYATAGHLSSRFAGSIRSPMFELGSSVQLWVKGKNARVSLIVRHYELVGRGVTTENLTKVINSDQWQIVRFDTRFWVGNRAYLEVLQNGGQIQFEMHTDEHVDGAYVVVGAASGDRSEPPARPNTQAWHVAGNVPETPAAVLHHIVGRLQSLADQWRSDRLTLANSDLLDGLHEAGIFDFSTSRSEALRTAVKAFRNVQDRISKPVYVRSLSDGNGEDEPVYIRGSHKNLSPAPNPRHFLAAIDSRSFLSTGSGRQEWAEALVSKDNPLTSRVMVNRIWHHLFGRGIVYSVDDFGHMGSQPSHPELLDMLAGDFIADDWSVKRLIRKLVLSSTYRMSSGASPDSLRDDPDNVSLQHMPIRRLQAEAIRDTILSISGALKPTMYGPSVNADKLDRRSIYVQLRRRSMPPFLITFDMPDGTDPFGRRNVTSTPAQSLELLNGSLVWKAANAWARRIVGNGGSFEDRVQRMHRRAFAREATPHEIEWARGLLRDYGFAADNAENSFGVWKEICHTMLNRKELIHVY